MRSPTTRLAVALFAAGSTVALVPEVLAPAVSVAAPRPSATATIPLLRAGNVVGYSTLDPDKTQGCNQPYCTLFQEHLLTYGSNGQLEPQLATSVVQTTPVTYVCHLRQRVRFWDGDEMTSADVVNSLEYQNGQGSETASYSVDVQSIKADGATQWWSLSSTPTRRGNTRSHIPE